MKRNGLTLVEILVAVALMVLVTGLAYVLYESVTRVQIFQQEKSMPASANVQALHTLSADLNSSVYVSDERCTFIMAETNDYPLLSFCCTLREADESDLRWHGIVATRYWVDTSGIEPALIRTQRPLIGPGAFLPPTTNVLVAGVSAFSLEGFDGDEWRSEWETKSFKEWPEAARLKLTLGEQDAESTQVLIPFGTVVESRLKRQ